MNINYAGKRRFRSGLSLIEVLASIFVLAVGLLGVLSVIPYGMYQLKRAAIAEYGGNCGRAAKHIVKIRGWDDKIEDGNGNDTYRILDNFVGADQTGNFYKPQGAPGSEPSLNCGQPIFIDPLGVAAENGVEFFHFDDPDIDGDPGPAIYRTSLKDGGGALGKREAQTVFTWSEDLVYVRGEQNVRNQRGRTVLEDSAGFPSSKGDFSWFVTVQPRISPTYTGSGYADVPVSELSGLDFSVVVCYTRTPGDSDKERVFDINGFTRYLQGGEIVLTESPDLTGTRFVFLVATHASGRKTGQWYRFVPTAGNRLTLIGPPLDAGIPASAYQLVVIQGVVNVFDL
ncbi:MAG TPA: hypothetical protein DEB39_14405 [Planctomycetaceae bacterium]|nr:hypothetical protein [Planctomycetaceae bacterium]